MEKEVLRLNARREMLRITNCGVARGLELLRAHVEAGGRIRQVRYDSDRYGKIITIHVGISRASAGYVADYSKYVGFVYDDDATVAFEHSFAKLEDAVAWIENKAGIPLADFRR